MKILLITVTIIAILFVVFQIYLTMATNKSKEQPYEVIRTESGFDFLL